MIGFLVIYLILPIADLSTLPIRAPVRRFGIPRTRTPFRRSSILRRITTRVELFFLLEMCIITERTGFHCALRTQFYDLAHNWFAFMHPTPIRRQYLHPPVRRSSFVRQPVRPFACPPVHPSVCLLSNCSSGRRSVRNFGRPSVC